MKSFRYTTLAVILGIMITSTSCQEQVSESPGSPDGSPQATASESLPTPSNERPDIPESATKKSKKGALSFGRHYYALVNYGRATGDWAPVKKATAPSCRRCEDFWAESPDRMSNDLSIRFREDPFVARFDKTKKVVVFDVSSDKNVEDVTRDPRNAWADQLHLEYSDSGWKVVGLEIKDLSDPPQSER